MTNPECKITDCQGNADVAGMCDMHYKRWYRYGDPEHQPRRYGIDPDATHKVCSKCARELPVSAFNKRTKRPGHYVSHCKECRAPSREKMLHKAVSHYGITGVEYLEMLDRQGGTCAICKIATTSGPSGVRLSVDHDHSTGAVRGLLCFSCNAALGMFRDDVTRLQAAIEYLRAMK